MRKREIHLNCLKGITSFWNLSLWHSYWYSVNRTLSSIHKAELFRLSKLEIKFNGWITNSENSQVAVYWNLNNNCVFLNKTWRLQALVPGSGRGCSKCPTWDWRPGTLEQQYPYLSLVVTGTTVTAVNLKSFVIHQYIYIYLPRNRSDTNV